MKRRKHHPRADRSEVHRAELLQADGASISTVAIDLRLRVPE